MRSGAVCDVSVLSDIQSFDLARKFFSWGDLYFPSSTYSWLSRDRLIEVRKQTLTHTLVSRLVREGRLIVVYLPEILDELSRRLLFEVDHKVPLTDIRAVMLASHLQVPLLTLDRQFTAGLEEALGARIIQEVHLPPDGWVFKKLLKDCRELASRLGSSLYSLLSNGGSLTDTLRALGKVEWEDGDGGPLSARLIVLSILDILRDYFHQNLLPLETIRKLCEASFLLSLTPEVFKERLNPQETGQTPRFF